jgi:aminopeptidase-like protein
MTGDDMFALAERLYPLCRSLTGAGVRETLAILGERLPLTIHAVATGTPVLDWTIPREWNVRDAWIAGADGQRLVDFRAHNLHLLGYSVPLRTTLTRAELEPHLHSLPERPGCIPYRTSYYRETWGFCLSQRQREALGEGPFEVVIDTTLADGALHYGELLVPGQTTEEVLLSTHICHPSLANDNLSGIVVLAALAARLSVRPGRYSYRFLFIPGTIGAIAWLAANAASVARVRAGLVAAGLGDSGAFHYKRSRRGNTEMDRAAVLALRDAGVPHAITDFVPFGYDERQFCSPGFDLPVGSLTRRPYGTYPEYHTSADDLTFISPAALAGSLALYERALLTLEGNATYVNLNPQGEPQLGRRGLYATLGGEDRGSRELALLWVLNLSDGDHDLLAIAARSGLAFAAVRAAADALIEAGLLRQSASRRE